MNLSQLTAEVGNITSSTSTARDGGFVNEAAHDLYTSDRWSWLESKMSVTLVAGTRAYKVAGTTPLITDCDGVYDVELVMTTAGAAVRLLYYPPQLFSRAFAHCFTNSQPAGWTILGGTGATTSATVVQGGQQELVLSHPPTAVAAQGVALTVYYWRSAAGIEMTATTDVPLAPTQLHRLIVTRACAIAMERNLMFQEAAGYQRAYQEGLARAMETDKANRFSDFEQVEIRPVPVSDPRAPSSASQQRPYPVAS